MIYRKQQIITELEGVLGKKKLITKKWDKQPYCKGWRYGSGEALAVALPETLLQIWELLEICLSHNMIIIMQAANTGLTGGSTPFGDDYDRPILIINTSTIDNIRLIKNGEQAICFAGSTLFDLENLLEPFSREPHSVIGSTSIGASVVGGVCNNSGGSLVHRGPAFTKMSLFAKINANGKLDLVNEIGIKLGENPIDILNNLQNNNYAETDILYSNTLCSDKNYTSIVRDIDSNIPARYNSDTRLLYNASGSAGKVAVFAVRLDTYPKPKENSVFYIGANNPDTFQKIRVEILSKFKNLPVSGDYVHRDCYRAAKKYSKDNFIILDKLGTKFLPTLFKFKRKIDFFSKSLPFLGEHTSDKIMQFLSLFWPNHLPHKMEDFNQKFEHHWIIEMSDEGIKEAKIYFKDFFALNEGSYFECNKKEGKKAILHRFTAASAFGRYEILHKNKIGGAFSMDIALPRNTKKWFEVLPKDIDEMIDLKLYYGHLFCHVMHQNYIVKRGVDPEVLKEKLLSYYDSIGADYPAEHNVGHEYQASENLKKFYKKLDPTNSFNPGIGRTSKKKFWK